MCAEAEDRARGGQRRRPVSARPGSRRQTEKQNYQVEFTYSPSLEENISVKIYVTLCQHCFRDHDLPCYYINGSDSFQGDPNSMQRAVLSPSSQCEGFIASWRITFGRRRNWGTRLAAELPPSPG
ncbi:uncharacterized protein LOC115346925 isoform X3 [Aquila chrysaetos chrysaetos]|uniref:uncharacterized protein LOC115346925 isoform X3 n=1 Tax=Aquila chrysaetos chrysaetos TaxID=223781 RepID=UPI001B7D446F|nr:uncharacterized protein LOC115346925 isoform X3 [Aquila chrysaetos chrysaetos]